MAKRKKSGETSLFDIDADGEAPPAEARRATKRSRFTRPPRPGP